MKQGRALRVRTVRAVHILRECLRQDLYGYAAAESGIRGLVNVAHSPRAQMSGDLVMNEFCSDHIGICSVRMLTRKYEIGREISRREMIIVAHRRYREPQYSDAGRPSLQ
jgi:hypothetical protein